MSGVAVTSLFFTVARLSTLKQMQAQGTEAALADQQSFIAGVREMYILSAAICSLAVVMSLVRGQHQKDKEGMISVEKAEPTAERIDSLVH